MSGLHARVDASRAARDLEALAGDLVGITAATAVAVSPRIVTATRALTPYGPGPRPGDPLPHIRDTITAGRGGRGVVSTHPAAIVFERGGVIAPRGTPIRIPRVAMAERAGEAQRPAIEADLQRRLQTRVT
jgi:hypothetical protein